MGSNAKPGAKGPAKAKAKAAIAKAMAGGLAKAKAGGLAKAKSKAKEHHLQGVQRSWAPGVARAGTASKRASLWANLVLRLSRNT